MNLAAAVKEQRVLVEELTIMGEVFDLGTPSLSDAYKRNTLTVTFSRINDHPLNVLCADDTDRQDVLARVLMSLMSIPDMSWRIKAPLREKLNHFRKKHGITTKAYLDEAENTIIWPGYHIEYLLHAESTDECVEREVMAQKKREADASPDYKPTGVPVPVSYGYHGKHYHSADALVTAYNLRAFDGKIPAGIVKVIKQNNGRVILHDWDEQRGVRVSVDGERFWTTWAKEIEKALNTVDDSREIAEDGD